MTATADILDEHPGAAVCTLELRSFGGRSTFSGPIATVRCDEDNALVKRLVGEFGYGRVLVVEGGGSRRVALVGDVVAGLAAASGWAGLVINGCVRDVSALELVDVGVVALAATPRPSGKTGAGEVDVAVRFGDVEFRAGDALYADADGILAARWSQTMCPA